MVRDKDVEESTPFYLAVESGSTECVEHLLKCGSSVNECNAYKTFPIHCACATGNLEIVKLLVKVRNLGFESKPFLC
jgi:ankyrin repeat protein